MTVNRIVELKNRPLQDEEIIVWLEPVERLPYVRVAEVACRKRTAVPKALAEHQRLVGYTVPCRDRTRRRIFFLEPHDVGGDAGACDAYLSGGAPVESKITSTIAPTVEGAHPFKFDGFAERVAAWKEQEG